MIMLWAVCRQAAGLTGPRVTSACYHLHSPASWDLKTFILDIGAQWGCCTIALYRPLCLWGISRLGWSRSGECGTGPGGNAPDFSLALRPTSHPFRMHLQRCSQINWRPPNCPPHPSWCCSANGTGRWPASPALQRAGNGSVFLRLRK